MGKLIVATRNPAKTMQIMALLGNVGMPVYTMTEADIVGEAVEDGSTLSENATKKAIFVCNQLSEPGNWYLAEDTGFFIDALGGRPGIHAARWAGQEKTTEEIQDYTLGQLKDVPVGERTATFKTVAVLITPDGELLEFEGIATGEILCEPQCASEPKMPYSGIHRPFASTKVWAEMSVNEVNAISHRGQAIRQVCDYIATHT